MVFSITSVSNELLIRKPWVVHIPPRVFIADSFPFLPAQRQGLKYMDRPWQQLGWRWHCRLEHWILFQRTRVLFPGPYMVLQTMCISSSSGSDTLFWPPWVLHTQGAHTYRQNTSTHKILKIAKVHFVQVLILNQN